MSFEDVLGHGRARAGLREALRAGRIPNAWLFVGPEGVGKRTLMAATAQALLCERGGDDACGACGACRRFAGGNHPDYVVLESEKEQVPVEEMRAFCRQVGLRPMAGARRICAVPEADRMTDASANCFLKTLEEPPGRAVLLLRAESTDRLLPTVVSRCQVVRLGPLPVGEIAAELARRGWAQAEAEALAVLSEGALGRALALAGEGAGDDWAWVRQTLPGMRAGDALPVARELIERMGSGNAAESRARALELLDLLALCLRRMLREGESPRRNVERLDAVWQAAERLQRNVTPALVLQALALELGE